MIPINGQSALRRMAHCLAHSYYPITTVLFITCRSLPTDRQRKQNHRQNCQSARPFSPDAPCSPASFRYSRPLPVQFCSPDSVLSLCPFHEIFLLCFLIRDARITGASPECNTPVTFFKISQVQLTPFLFTI